MSGPLTRRSFVAGGLAATAALADLSFLGSLPVLSARDVKADPKLVQFSPDIEPLVRLIEERSSLRGDAAREALAIIRGGAGDVEAVES